jgi:hypothetical protein
MLTPPGCGTPKEGYHRRPESARTGDAQGKDARRRRSRRSSRNTRSSSDVSGTSISGRGVTGKSFNSHARTRVDASILAQGQGQVVLGRETGAVEIQQVDEVPGFGSGQQAGQLVGPQIGQRLDQEAVNRWRRRLEVCDRVEHQIQLDRRSGELCRRPNEGPGIPDHVRPSTGFMRRVRKGADQLPVEIAIVHEKVCVGGQAMAQVSAGQRCATAEMKRHPLLATLEQMELLECDDARVEAGHALVVSQSLLARGPRGQWSLQQVRP